MPKSIGYSLRKAREELERRERKTNPTGDTLLRVIEETPSILEKLLELQKKRHQAKKGE